MKLDTKSSIFQNLNGAMNEIDVVTVDDNMVVYNSYTENYPAFFHGNGPTKVSLRKSYQKKWNLK